MAIAKGTKNITINLSDEVIAVFDKQAKAEFRTRGQLIKMLLVRHAQAQAGYAEMLIENSGLPKESAVQPTPSEAQAEVVDVASIVNEVLDDSDPSNKPPPVDPKKVAELELALQKAKSGK